MGRFCPFLALENTSRHNSMKKHLEGLHGAHRHHSERIKRRE